jgi:Protein of unknown function (DUF2950)
MKTRFPWISCLALLACACPALRADADKAAGAQRRFESPGEAVKALAAATKAGDRAAVDAIFGPDVKELLSGDPRQDAIEFADFAKAIGQYHHLVHTSLDSCVVDVGAQNWPMPIPLVRRDGAWFFDTDAGKDEVLSRRIGEDELTAIGVCRTYVTAQREYASEERDASGVVKYAQRLKSTPGEKDGLFWEAQPGEEESPLGPLVAEAREEGYGPGTGGKPQPFHGYRFKILAAQGPSAPGGAYSYVINGNMVAGFAMVAYPAHWGESGVMTFLVGQSGKVFQRNLGPDSADIGAAMAEFDPDPDWAPVPSP